MEAQWIADRATLRALAQAHPDWGPKELAEAVGRCLSWAKKWLKRFSLAPADDQDVLRSRSRAHHTPYRRVPQAIVQRILEIREQPPENLHRTPGRHPPSSITCAVTRHLPGWAQHCPGRAAPSGGSCAASAVSSMPRLVVVARWSWPSQ